MPGPLTRLNEHSVSGLAGFFLCFFNRFSKSIACTSAVFLRRPNFTSAVAAVRIKGTLSFLR